MKHQTYQLYHVCIYISRQQSYKCHIKDSSSPTKLILVQYIKTPQSLFTWTVKTFYFLCTPCACTFYQIAFSDKSWGWPIDLKKKVHMVIMLIYYISRIQLNENVIWRWLCRNVICMMIHEWLCKKYVFTSNIFLFVSMLRFSLPLYHLDHNKCRCEVLPFYKILKLLSFC